MGLAVITKIKHGGNILIFVTVIYCYNNMYIYWTILRTRNLERSFFNTREREREGGRKRERENYYYSILSRNRLLCHTTPQQETFISVSQKPKLNLITSSGLGLLLFLQIHQTPTFHVVLT